MPDVIPVLVPHETVNDETVKLTSWLLPSGEKVQADQLVAQVETSKALLDIHAPADGFLRYQYELGCEIPVGAAICYITAAADTPLPAPAPLLPVSSEPHHAMLMAGHAAPHTRRHAADSGWEPGSFSSRFSKSAWERLQERGLDPAQFAHLPLVRARDIDAATPAEDEGMSAPPSRDGVAPGVLLHWDELSRRKLGEIRYLRTARANSLLSSVTVACPTHGWRELLRTVGGTITAPTPIIVFEAARLLRNYPAFNAVCADGRAGYYDEVNIGVAIDYDKGLFVPVVRNADQKSLAEIAEQMWELMYKYLRQELSAEDLSGGTFTVSDLSAEGVVSFAPLINQGQSAILGVGSEIFPVAGAAGSFNLMLAFDHQLGEGRMAARFLNDLAERLKTREGLLREHPEVTLEDQEKMNS